MKYYLLFSITFLFNSLQSDSCKTFILQNILNKNEVVNLSELSDNIRFIKLEYTPESVLSYIKEAFLFSDYILVYDVKNNLCLFNKEGKFIRRIGKIGRGPGEYTNILDIDINTKSKLIYILNNSSQKLISYDFQGNFIPTSISCSEKISFCFYENMFFLHTPSNVMLLRSNTDENFKNQLDQINSQGTLMRTFHPLEQINKTRKKFIETASFSIDSNILFYYVYGENTLYSIKDNIIKSEFCFDFGKYSSDNSEDEIPNNSDQSENISIIDIRIVNKHIFLNYRRNNKPGLLFFDTKLFRNVNSENGGTFNDDIDGTGKIFYQLFIRDNMIIEPIDARKILKYDPKLVSPRVLNLIKETNEIDNPVLRIISIK